MGGSRPIPRRRPDALSDSLFGAVFIGVAVFLLARSCLSLSSALGGDALWPVNGVLLAATLKKRGLERSLVLAVGCFGDFAARALEPQGLHAAGVLGLCDGLEVVVAIELLHRLAGEAVNLAHFRDFMLFLTIAGCSAPMTSAAAQALLMGHPLDGDFRLAVMKDAFADALGVLIVCPPMLSLSEANLKSLDRAIRSGRGLSSAVLLIGVNTLILGQTGLPLFFLGPMILVFVAFELGVAGAALALLASAAATLFVSAHGHGPLALVHAPPDVRLRGLQGYLAALVFSIMPVAAALARRDQLELALREALTAAKLGESRAAEALRDSRLAQKIAGVGSWRYDRRTETTTWSDDARAIHGFDDARPARAPDAVEALYRREDRELVSAFIERALTSGAAFEVRARFRLPFDAEERTAVFCGEAEFGADGRACGVIGVVRDVTREESARRRIEESEARYRAIAENASDIIIRMTVKGEILYISPSVSAISGYTPKDLIGRALHEVLHPDDSAHAKAYIARLADGTRTTAAQTFRIRRRDGSIIWIESNPTVLTDDDGAPREVIDVLRDISQRVVLEAELRAARDAAEAAASIKADFMANMSHEIRTPLTAILGFTRLIEDRGDLVEEVRASLRRIAAAGQTLLAIVNDILDFSKLEAGQVRIEAAAMNPAALVQDTLGLFEPEAARKGVELRYIAAPGLPDWIEADAYRLRQIVMNLIGNAVKFTDEGAVTVSCAYEAALRRLTVSVADTGPGLSAAQAQNLFKRFSQVDASITRRHGGTGLGLAICKGLADMMGGDVSVASTPGEGAVFTVFIDAPEAEAPPNADGRAETPGLADARILVVDDNPANRELVRAILAPTGATLSEARNGKEALEAAGSALFDVVLMDLQMPGMDGFATTLALRSQDGPNRAVPVLAFSADGEIDDRRKLADFDGFVQKPIAPAELLAALSAALLLPDKPPVRTSARLCA